MNAKKFISRIAIKVILFSIFTALTLSVLDSPVITNKIALGQMENSNEMYLLMEIYNKIRPMVSIIYGFVVVQFAATTIRDICKFIQTKTKEKN